MIKIVIFDFDGVFLDNYELHYTLSQKQIRGITREEHRQLFDGNVSVEREKLSDRDTGFDLKTVYSEAKLDVVIDADIKKTLKLFSKKQLISPDCAKL